MNISQILQLETRLHIQLQLYHSALANASFQTEAFTDLGWGTWLAKTQSVTNNQKLNTISMYDGCGDSARLTSRWFQCLENFSTNRPVWTLLEVDKVQVYSRKPCSNCRMKPQMANMDFYVSIHLLPFLSRLTALNWCWDTSFSRLAAEILPQPGQ